MKKLNEIQLEIQRLKKANDINKDRLNHFQELGDIEAVEMYNRMINLEWVMD